MVKAVGEKLASKENIMRPHWCILHPSKGLALVTVETSMRGKVEATIQVVWTLQGKPLAQNLLSAFGNPVFFLAVKWNLILHIASRYIHLESWKNAKKSWMTRTLKENLQWKQSFNWTEVEQVEAFHLMWYSFLNIYFEKAYSCCLSTKLD